MARPLILIWMQIALLNGVLQALWFCEIQGQIALAFVGILAKTPSIGCCSSSVVERVIGNDEVGSSILPCSTIFTTL
tara:strand:- start:404 stop:634 length:231 start_codon:yes stop_codon:yes gene_type:complete